MGTIADTPITLCSMMLAAWVPRTPTVNRPFLIARLVSKRTNHPLESPRFARHSKPNQRPRNRREEWYVVPFEHFSPSHPAPIYENTYKEIRGVRKKTVNWRHNTAKGRGTVKRKGMRFLLNISSLPNPLPFMRIPARKDVG